MKIVRAGIPVFVLLLPFGRTYSGEADWKPVGEAPRAVAPDAANTWKPSGQPSPSGDPFRGSPTLPVIPASGTAAIVPPFPSLAPAAPPIVIRPVEVVPPIALVVPLVPSATAVGTAGDAFVLEPVRLQIPKDLLPAPEPVPVQVPPASIPKPAAPAPILEAPRLPSPGPAFVPTPAKKPGIADPKKILPPLEKAKTAEPPLIRLPGLRELPKPEPKKASTPPAVPVPEATASPVPASPRPESPYGAIGVEPSPILPPEIAPPVSRNSATPPPRLPVPGGATPPPGRLGSLLESPRRTSSMYARADYLLWWMSAPRIPLLATTGPLSTSGIVGLPGTLPLIGPRELDTSSRSGGRFTVGYVPNDDWGFEGEYFFLSPESTRLAVGSGSHALISRPYVSQQRGETASIVVAPFLASGTLSVDSRSEIHGFDALLTKNLGDRGGFRTTALAGFRYLDFSEELTVTESILTGPRALDPLGTRIGVRDSFSTRNRFYGAMLGLSAEQCFGRFDLRVRGSVSLGAIEESQNIAGAVSRQVPGGVPTLDARGLFATPANAGRYSRTEFGAIPELGATVGYHVSRSVHLTAGYQLLYINSVLRPGDQIDRVVDASLISFPPPGTIAGTGTRPAPMFHETDLFLHGLTLGLELRW